jgi:hypothetical protein
MSIKRDDLDAGRVDFSEVATKRCSGMNGYVGSPGLRALPSGSSKPSMRQAGWRI